MDLRKFLLTLVTKLLTLVNAFTNVTFFGGFAFLMLFFDVFRLVPDKEFT